MSELPPGFVLDQPTESALPPGFVLDSPSIAEDAAKSVGAGLGNAAIGTLGAAGDLRSLLSSGADLAGSKLGFDPSTLKRAAAVAANFTPLGVLNSAPTSQDIRSTVSDPIVSPDYQPQYETGRLLKKGAEFAPNMLLGGPEGLGARLLTNVAAPAVGSEVGERLAGPYGGVAGALVGGAGAMSAAQKFNQMAAARNASKAIPTGEELLKSGSSGFEAVKASDAVIKPSAVEQMAKDIRTELLNDGKHPTLGNQSGIFNTLDRLETMGASGGGVTPKDLEVIRKNLVAEKKSLDGGTREAAKMATDAFMSKYSSLGQADILSGSNPFPTLKNAVGDWAAGKRSAAVTGKADLAALNAGTAGSGANEDNALRQAMKQLARPINNTNVPVAKRLGFSDPEIDAIKQAATGTTFGNTARYLGKLAPTGSVSGVLSGGAGFAAAGPLGAIGLPAAGYIAKKIGDLSTKRAVAAVDSLVRSRSPLATQVAAQVSPQIVSQLPVKSQQILQTMQSAAATAPPQSQIRQQASRPIPSMPPSQPVAPQHSISIPTSAPPIFAAPKVMPTAAADGQPSRPSRIGLGENIRLGKYQDWEPGRIVKVGFVDGLKVEGTVPASYPGDAAGFLLTKGDKVYRATPHRGMEKLSAADGKHALEDLRKSKGS
jgi:hypothetical protein